MGKAPKAHASEDIWHLSIEDLLAQPAERPQRVGRGPFVINLTTSAETITAAPRGVPASDRLHVYQLTRRHEGRVEFQLRVGLFTSDLEADAILASLREHYPRATREAADDDDRAAVAAVACAAEVATASTPAPPVEERIAEAPKAEAVTMLPEVSTPAAESEPFTWDVDDLLPDLAVTRPSRREPQPMTRELPELRPATPESECDPNAVTDQVESLAFLVESGALEVPESLRDAEVDPEAPSNVMEQRDESDEAVIELDDVLSMGFVAPEVRSSEPTMEVRQLESAMVGPSESPATDPVAEWVEARQPAPGPDGHPKVREEVDDDRASESGDAGTTASAVPPESLQAVELPVSAEVPPTSSETPVHVPAPVSIESPTRIDTSTDAETSIELEMPALLEEPEDAEMPTHSEPAIDLETPTHIEVTADIEMPAPVAAPIDVEMPVRIEAAAVRSDASAPSELPALAEPLTAAEFCAPSTSSAPSVADSAANDSGTIESLVARIGALVATAEDADARSAARASIPSEPVVARIPRIIPEVAHHATPNAAKPSPLTATRIPTLAPERTDALAIDSTQTIRALTPLELADDQASPWFSIQLMLCEEPIAPEHVPHLDIFEEYRLYSVTGLEQERVMNALRLGFFSSELAAQAVAGYLSAFFDAPCIKRVSMAERERFAEKRLAARKDIGETGMHAVIELTSPTPLPQRLTRASSASADKRGVLDVSLWSRLISPLKR